MAPLRHAPSPDAPLDTEALKGERVTVYETNDEGWAWGQLDADGYVGFVPAAALRDPARRRRKGLRTAHTCVSRPVDQASPSRGCRSDAGSPSPATSRRSRSPPLAAMCRHATWCRSTGYENDFVAVAERFLGAPYLWGGKSNLGLDCSALVQLALTACGVPCPRDSDMQEHALGTLIASDFSALRRGDLLF